MSLSASSDPRPSGQVTRRILVTLATGKQGSHVVRALARRNNGQQKLRYEVLAVTRDRLSAKARDIAALNGVWMIESEYEPKAIFEKAMATGSGGAVHGVFSVQLSFDNPLGISGEIAQGKGMVDAAAENGVEQFVYSSGDGAILAGKGVRHFDSKAEIEEHLMREARISSKTVIQPAIFMDALRISATDYRSRLANSAIVSNMPVRVPMLACSDVGEFAALAFDDPTKFSGLRLPLAGDYISGQEIKTTYKAMLKKDFPASPGLIGQNALRLRPEIYNTFHMIAEHSQRPDFDTLRGLHPNLKTFRIWLSDQQ